MPDRFSEPVDWAVAGWALTVWTAHFMVLWGASSVFPADPAARWIALGATVVALAALAWLWRARPVRSVRSVPAFGMGMAALAIVLGALPAVVG